MKMIDRSFTPLVTSQKWVCLVTLFFMSISGLRLLACGQTPKPPICGKSMAFSMAGPATPVLLGAGGLVDIPVVIFATTTAGCTSSASLVTIDLTVTCSGFPDATGTLTTAIVNGYNELLVPVTLLPGPPRKCGVTGTATVTFTDSMMLRSTSDSDICISEPAPQDPALARLSMKLLSPTLNCVHPGDQARVCYEITNNDPIETFTGTLSVEIKNSATLPEDLGPQANGEGVYSLADPVGDNPPIVFEDYLHPGYCVPLPLDPHLTVPSQITRSITLLPGETQTIYVLSRHWGLCTSGTCSRSKACLEGLYTDMSEGLACSGTVIGADTDKTPGFLWDGSGYQCAAQSFDPGNAIGRLISQLPDGTPVIIDVSVQTIDVNGSPVFDGFDYLDPIDGHELRGQFFLQTPIQTIDTVVGRTQIDFMSVGPEIQIELVELSLVSVAPIGFFDIGPLVVGTFEIDKVPADGVPDGFLTFLGQTSIVGFAGTQFPGNEMTDIDIFTDGFESGYVTLWSRPGGNNRGGAGLDGIQVFFDIRGFVHEKKAQFPCPGGGLTGDFNGDWLVDRYDLWFQMNMFHQPGTAPMDRNGDGIINVLDGVGIIDLMGCQELMPPL